MHPFDQNLIKSAARHAAFVRSHGRYPYVLSNIWPSAAAIVVFAGIETGYALAGWIDRGHWFIFSISLVAVTRIIVRNVRSLYFRNFRTNVPVAEGATSLQVALNAAGFSIDWTPSGEAAILFGTTGSGSRKARHGVVFIPAEGCIWYTAHDPSALRFFVVERKPLRSLVAILESYFGPWKDAVHS